MVKMVKMVKEENECKIIFNIFLVHNNIGKKEIKKERKKKERKNERKKEQKNKRTKEQKNKRTKERKFIKSYYVYPLYLFITT
jgi:nitrate reductase cytochrome c-type subunit